MSTSVQLVIDFISEQFEANRNDSDAIAMQNYMKNKFPFFGIKAEKRRAIFTDAKARFKNDVSVATMDFVFCCFEQPEREWHQLAVDVLISEKKRLPAQSLKDIERLIVTHSWWDTVDMLATHVAGELFKKYPDEIPVWINAWRYDSNMWLNRTCLLFQLKYKNKVDTELLSDLVLQFSSSTEFFIQKAIGWTLREYSKVNPDWVVACVEQIPLKPLSKREALRKIK